MEDARISIVGIDPPAARAHAAALARIGFKTLITNDFTTADEIERTVVLLADHSCIGDVRRLSPAVSIVLACDDEAAESVAHLLEMDGLAFLGGRADSDYAIALASLRVERGSRLAEGDPGYALRLAALGEEIARIARAIEPPSSVGDERPPVPDAPLTFDPAILRATLKARRLRDSLFPAGTFADPTWDMLLDLAASRAEGRPVSVTSVAIAAAVPTSTALRHLKAMADAGMVVRRPDPDDGRRIYIDLSEDALARMRAWVAAAGKPV